MKSLVPLAFLVLCGPSFPDTGLNVQGPRSRRTVVAGTFTWQIDIDKLGFQPACDLWWTHSGDRVRSLDPMNGATFALVKNRSFESLDPRALAALPFSTNRIDGSTGSEDLKPGAVFAVKTGKGDLVKLKVVRYYRLHDFTYAGSERILSEAWKADILTRPDQECWSIELEWVLYPARR